MLAKDMQEQDTSDINHDSEGEFKRKLSRALLHFQDRLLEANITPGSLCQVRRVHPVCVQTLSQKALEFG